MQMSIVDLDKSIPTNLWLNNGLEIAQGANELPPRNQMQVYGYVDNLLTSSTYRYQFIYCFKIQCTRREAASNVNACDQAFLDAYESKEKQQWHR